MNHVVGLLLARISTNLSALGTLVVVGLFLSPAEFGLFAVASALAAAPQQLVGAGFYEHTLAHDPDGHDEWTAFWSSALMGAAGGLLLLVTAGLVWWIFKADVISLLLCGLALHMTLWSLYISHEARQLRDGHGKTVAFISVSADVVAFLALLLSLKYDMGVYCLLVNRLVSGTVACALYWLCTPWPTGARFSVARGLQIAKGSLGIMGGRLMTWLNAYAGEFVIVAFLSAYGVGLYRMGVRLFIAAASILLQAPAPGILATVGAARRQGPARLSNVVRRTTQVHLAFALPLFGLAGVLAPRFLPLLLGPKWTASIQVFQVLDLSAVQGVFVGINAAVLTSAGRTGMLFWFISLSSLAGFIGISTGALVGPVAAAAGHTLATTPIALFVFWAWLKLPRRMAVRTLKSTLAICAATVVMVAAIWALERLLDMPGGLIPQLAQLTLLTVAGLGVYGATAFILAPHTFRLWRFIIQRNVRRLGSRLALSPQT